MEFKWTAPSPVAKNIELPLTYGQQYIWNQLQQLLGKDEHLNIAEIIALPGRPSVASISSILSLAMSKWNVLRLTFPVDCGSQPIQRLTTSGRISIHERSTTSGREVEADLLDLRDSLQTGSYDLSQFPLFRVGILIKDGVVTHLGISFSHMLIDALGAQCFGRWLLGELRSPGGPVGAVRVSEWQPSDQVAWEQSDDGLEIARRSLEYWESQLQKPVIEQTRLSAPLTTQAPRWWAASIDTKLIVNASGVLARKLKVTPNSVVTAVAGLALGIYAGSHWSRLLLLASNRFTAPQRNAVGQYAQCTPVTFDLGITSAQQYIKTAHENIVTAYRHGTFDPIALESIVSRISRSTDVPLQLHDSLNCRRPINRPVSPPIIDALEHKDPSEVTIKGFREFEALRTFWSYSAGRVFSLAADTNWMSPEDMRVTVQHIETTIVAAAEGEDNLDMLKGLRGGGN